MDYISVLDGLSRKYGFSAWGYADASRLDTAACKLEEYLEKGYNASMECMARNKEKRTDASVLVENAVTVIVFLARYSARPPCASGLKVASYAQGEDYHHVIKGKLSSIIAELESIAPDFSGRTFTDSAPLMEREYAVRAGLGFIGKNGMLVSRAFGNRVLIGSIVCNLGLPPHDRSFNERVGKELRYDNCGACTRCMDACPGKAVSNCVLDARRCISYQTIESRRSFRDEEFPVDRKGWIFGCDECIQACPWYRRGGDGGMPEFDTLSDVLCNLRADDWLGMGSGAFKRMFGSSPISRAGLKKMKDNVMAVLGSRNAVGCDSGLG